MDKICPRCKESKPATREYWHRSRHTRDGLYRDCKECVRVLSAARWATMSRARKDAHNQTTSRRKAAARYEVLDRYSQGAMCCACCGENHLEFLCIDHINGRSATEKRTGAKLYKWLIDHNFPEGFRVLCHNCNQSLGWYHYCPHQSKA